MDLHIETPFVHRLEEYVICLSTILYVFLSLIMKQNINYFSFN